MTSCPGFAIYYAGDAYSSAKLMGRQSAGRAFMKGVARTWPQAYLHGAGMDKNAGDAMYRQLRGDGFDGKLHWRCLPDWGGATATGALHYPAPPPKALAAARNLVDPRAFSLMGVTHSLASGGAMDQVADLVLPPFKPWDALICTSQAARELVTGLQDDVCRYWEEHAGATRFAQVQLPVIPLGVNVSEFARSPDARQAARAALALDSGATAFLFTGRLSFHAKANPAAVYQALEKAACASAIVCIEAGVFPNQAIRRSYLEAQRALAPSVRFIWIDGKDEPGYRQAWQAADVFVSLADNVQETFGLTPVEAMAAGLPVVVSDWSGYKDTVRDGVDGLRIPTVMPPSGFGGQQALRHALGLDSYDRYIGGASLATVVAPQALADALGRLAADPSLRARMGAAGLARSAAEYDWPLILRRYDDFAAHLATLRKQAGAAKPEDWPQRADPYRRFAHFSSTALAGDWNARARPGAAGRLPALLSLSMTTFAFESQQAAERILPTLLSALASDGGQTVDAALSRAGLTGPIGIRALMWLWKFDLVEVKPPSA